MKSSLQGRGCYAALVGALLTLHSVSAAEVATFDVDVGSPQFTLYTGPYNGNEIKVGGFSGIYPVAGKPDCFYVDNDFNVAETFVQLDLLDANFPRIYLIPGP